MGTNHTFQTPVRMAGAGKRDIRTQFAALPFRVKKGEIEILLLTSRDTGRWIIPKGWPMDGLTPAGSAAQEAWEEAGVRGVVSESCLGFFSYNKGMDKSADLSCLVAVFPLEVRKLSKKFPEAGMRKRKWVSVRKAVAKLDDRGLKSIVRHFSPDDHF